MDQNRGLLVLGITATATMAAAAIAPAHADAASPFVNYKGQATVNLNVRSTPSTAKSPLTTLKKGTTFEVVGKSGDWLKILYKNKQNYVFGKFVKKVSASAASSSAKKQSVDLSTLYTGTVTADVLNVRASAGTGGKIEGTLKKGTSVSVVGTSGNWLKIKYKSGYAYVSGSYVKKASSATVPSSVQPGADLKVLYTGTVTADVLNVRASASTGGKIEGTLKKGTSVSVVGTSGNWLKVKYKSGYAYVSATYVKKPTASDPKPETAAVLYTGTVTADVLNVRSAAGTSGSVLGTLKKGTSVSVVGTSGSWLKIKYKSGYAYVSATYVKKPAASDPPPSSDPAPSAPKTLYTGVTTTAVNIRSQAKMGDNVLTTYSAGTTVSVVGETADGWLKINYKNTYAYVYKDYVSGGPDTTTTTTTGNSSYGTTNYSISFGQALSEEQAVNSSSSLSYYLNPKNFPKGTAGYYQFFKLSSLANISESDAAKILSGRGILSGHADDFLYAAKKEKVNEIYLMAHALLETGNGTSQLAKGVKYNGVTVYNFFGIGAYDGSAVSSGAAYAYNEGWTSPAAAILGGAEWIANYYIYNSAYHQDTLYKMRWNPAALETGAAAHQYATDPGWAYKQTSTIQTMYQMLSDYTIVYDVPAYK